VFRALWLAALMSNIGTLRAALFLVPASAPWALLPVVASQRLGLVGTPTLPDSLRATRVHGVVCFTGMLSNQWIVKDFYPIAYIPRGVRFTAYGGDASDLPAQVLQDFLDPVAAGKATVPIDHVYRFDEIVAAHTTMEAGTAKGKLVVTT
jgi:NADPH:quinone reductase-like Zn-dependent oxidoreductase